MEALNSGNIGEIESLISRNDGTIDESLLYYTNSNGDNGIMIATKLGYTDLLRYLIFKGFHVDHQNFEGSSALHLCASSSIYQHEILFLLKSHSKNDICLQDRRGFTPLHLAILNKSLTDKEQYISQSNINVCTFEGETALHMCTEKEEIELLLRNSNINMRIKSYHYGQTPLLMYCKKGNVLGAFLILEYCFTNNRADILQDVDYRGANFMHISIIRKQTLIILKYREMLERKMNENTEYGKLFSGILKMKTIKGNTCLHAAAFVSDFKITEILISMGCSTESKNLDGYTPSEVSKDENVRQLIEEASLSELLSNQIEIYANSDGDFAVAKVARCILHNGKLLFLIISSKISDIKAEKKSILYVKRSLEDFGALRNQLLNEMSYLCL